MPKYRANRDRYQSNTYVNDGHRNKYYITEHHNSFSDAQRGAYATRKEESDSYQHAGIRADIYSKIHKLPQKRYRRK